MLMELELFCLCSAEPSMEPSINLLVVATVLGGAVIAINSQATTIFDVSSCSVPLF